jgi:hypothetical protein
VIGESITEGGPEEIVNPIPVQDQSSSERRTATGTEKKFRSGGKE